MQNFLFATFFAQLCLASLALAAPVAEVQTMDAWQFGTGGGIIGLIVLVLDIIVFGTSGNKTEVEPATNSCSQSRSSSPTAHP